MNQVPPNLARVEQEEVVSLAFAIHQDIVSTIDNIRRNWVDLAGHLYAFHTAKAWKTLGYESLETWLASPEIEIAHRMFHNLVETYRELHIERGIHPDEIARVDVSKAQAVLPAIRRGQVTPETALADAENLSRTDLREKYQAILPRAPKGSGEGSDMTPDAFHYEKCPTCGANNRVRD